MKTYDYTVSDKDRRDLATPLPVFVFGTLRPGYGNSVTWATLGSAVCDGTAYIDNHRLVSNGWFPYCIPADGQTTYGTLIVAYDDDFPDMIRRMDQLEGVPVHYMRRRIIVHTPVGDTPAWYYLPDDWHTYQNMPPVDGNDWRNEKAPRL